MGDIKFLDLRSVTALHSEAIEAAVMRTVRSGWYLQGAENARFESNYADYIGTRYAVGCGNGLDALRLIYRALIEMKRLKPADEVIVPANTYIASILAISDNGLVPVLVEPDAETGQIDSRLIESHITPATRSILLVHLYGRCAYTERIGEIAARNNLILIEDNAQAHGCFYHGRRTGSLGLAAGHSFYPGKNLGALGDGGMVTTDDEELARTVRTIANYGSEKKYIFRYQGWNSRLDEIQAAVLDAKLPYLDADNDKRREIAEIYGREIRNPLVSLPAPCPPEENVYHIYPIHTERRDELRHYLADNGIETLIHYPVPPHLQKCYPEWNNLNYPVTEKLADTELSLPISPAMQPEEAMTVCRIINEWKIQSP